MRYIITGVAIVILLLSYQNGWAEECMESRADGYTPVEKKRIGEDYNVKCSETTGAVLWWKDPYDGTKPMGDMPKNIEADYLHEEAVVKSRKQFLKFYPCTNCHNGVVVPFPKNKKPRALIMHLDIVPDPLNLKHGKGAIWCLDCHNPRNRNTFISHSGEPIDMDQPQKLCGKCHGQIYRDWRDGIHGKRIGSWQPGGKKRWWVCTECHNPHDVEPGFKALKPEPPPELPKGMTSAEHEREHH